MLKISDFRVIIIFISLGLLAVPLGARLSFKLFPSDASSQLTVYFRTRPLYPEVVEKNATSILENAFSQISQLRKLESRSTHTGGEIHLSFDRSADMAMKRFELASIIRLNYPNLLSSISYPLILSGDNRKKARHMPIMVYSIYADSDASLIAEESEKAFLKELLMIDGLDEAQLEGSERKIINISYDRDLLKAVGLSLDEIYRKMTETQIDGVIGSIQLEGDYMIVQLQQNEAAQLVDTIEDLQLYPSAKVHIF